MPRIRITGKKPKALFGMNVTTTTTLDPNYIPNIDYKNNLDDVQAPEMSSDEQLADANNKNYQNWLQNPKNEMSVSSWGKDFYTGTGAPTPQYNEYETYDANGNPKKKPVKKKRTGINFEKISQGIDNTLLLGSGLSRWMQNNERNAGAEERATLNSMNPTVDYAQNYGDWRTNGGDFQPRNVGPFSPYGMYSNKFYSQNNFPATGAYGGTLLKDSDMDKIKIRIVSGPGKMAYGGQSGYGFDLGQRNTWRAMPKNGYADPSKTVAEDPEATPDEHVLEAEHNETILTPDGLHKTIKGKRHTEGGVKLTKEQAPEGSFIFSDTKNMRIKDAEILKLFGMSPRKSGYTPAEIAKKYDVNKYEAILIDPKVDPVNKRTAELMIDNCHKKLGMLALIQEQMKGFPQGIPEMAKRYIPEIAAKYEQQAEPGEGTPQEQMSTDEEPEVMSMYGGDLEYGGYIPEYGDYAYGGGYYQVGGQYDSRVQGIMGQLPVFNYGNQVYAIGGESVDVDPASAATTTAPPDWSANFERLKELLTSDKFKNFRTKLYQRYKAGRGKNDDVTEQEYIDNLLESQRQKYMINEAYKDKPEILKSKDWDKGGRNKYYNKIAGDLGLTPQSEKDIERGQNAYLDFIDLLSSDPEFRKEHADKFILNPVGVEDEPEYKGIKNVTRPDSWRGNTDIGQLIRMADNTVVGYMCTKGADGKAKLDSKTFNSDAEMTAAGYKTQAEASADCIEIPSKKTTTVTTSPPLKVPPPQGPPAKVPFDFTAPAKLAMATALAVPPIKIGPWYDTVNLQAPVNHFYSPERALAANAEGVNTLLQGYQGPMQGYSAVGNEANAQAAARAQNIISDYADKNVAAANQASQQQAAIANEQAKLDADRHNKIYQGWATANQNFNNETDAFLQRFAKTYRPAWEERATIHGINMGSGRNFYFDPSSGQNIWKGTKDTSYATSGDTGMVDPFSLFETFYSQVKTAHPDWTDDQVRELAQSMTTEHMKAKRTPGAGAGYSTVNPYLGS